MKLDGKDSYGAVLHLHKFQATLKAQVCRHPVPRLPAWQKVCWSPSKTTANPLRFPMKWSPETVAAEKQKGAMRQNTITSVKAGLGSDVCIKIWESENEESGILLDSITVRRSSVVIALPALRAQPLPRCAVVNAVQHHGQRRGSPSQGKRVGTTGRRGREHHKQNQHVTAS